MTYTDTSRFSPSQVPLRTSISAILKGDSASRTPCTDFFTYNKLDNGYIWKETYKDMFMNHNLSLLTHLQYMSDYKIYTK